MRLVAAIVLPFVVHEQAHWAVARWLGYPAKYVLTWKGPGVMWGDNRLSPPLHRMMVAAAGPSANIWLAIVGFAFGWTALAYVSLIVGLTQLVPLGPSDGRHILEQLKGAG